MPTGVFQPIDFFDADRRGRGRLRAPEPQHIDHPAGSQRRGDSKSRDLSGLAPRIGHHRSIGSGRRRCNRHPLSLDAPKSNEHLKQHPWGKTLPSKSLLGAAVMIAATLNQFRGEAVAASTPKTVVLVHGAFADGSSWRKVRREGLRVVAVQNPLSSLVDDVGAMKRVIDAQPGSVILVGHSWAGLVISQTGVADKVKALVYVAAFAPPKSVSINDLGKGQPPAPWLADLQPDSAGYLRLGDQAVAKYFAQDLSAEDIRITAATQGRPSRESSTRRSRWPPTRQSRAGTLWPNRTA